ncbi:MAG: metal ABC transporter substrate-binding protein [Verrucomicrobiales bacterium]|nr:metal ABC transporter substrate-binding protein [Verrucomicrobiales bacterium]
MRILLSFLSSAFVTGALVTVSFAQKPIVVQAANYPLAYFADRIATESFDVQYLVDPDVDPAFWKPSDEAMMRFQQADIILRNGATYSKWMHHASLPVAAIVDTSREFRDKLIETEGDSHTHGDGNVHSHGGVAFTTWIDFSQASVQAEAIARRFAAVKPSEAASINSNLAALKADLEELDSTMKELGGEIGEIPLMASHPIYQYFARAYHLNIESLEWEPEMEMTDKALGDFADLRETHEAAWMIWEGEPTPENVTALAAQGVNSLVFSPCANRPEKGDWLSVIKDNIKNLRVITVSE